MKDGTPKFTCPNCGSTRLSIRATAEFELDGEDCSTDGGIDIDLDDTTEAWCRNCNTDPFTLSEASKGATIPAEVWYQWQQYACVAGYEIEGKRLLTPWADPHKHEHPWDELYKTPDAARTAKAADDDANEEDWVLCKVTTEPVDNS